ncbi:hypothetical protein FFLO_02128 [Filobasidium floriforme]|uniref:Uncharacterized protein n=1 Tax=Filobasidium floriforme TaxID=5210 RepID=A0A8K0JN83_9TREE|nr:hypothetical protein FFLO_02128 [Filobasidium floriforme]
MDKFSEANLSVPDSSVNTRWSASQSGPPAYPGSSTTPSNAATSQTDADRAELLELRHMYRNSTLQPSGQSYTASSVYSSVSDATSMSITHNPGDGGLRMIDPIPKHNPYSLPLKGFRTKKYNPDKKAPGWHKDYKMQCQTAPQWQFLTDLHQLREQNCDCGYDMHLPVPPSLCANSPTHIRNDAQGRRILKDQPYNRGNCKPITTGDWDAFIDTLDPLILGDKTLRTDDQNTLDAKPQDELELPSRANHEQREAISARNLEIRSNNGELLRRQKTIRIVVRATVFMIANIV